MSAPAAKKGNEEETYLKERRLARRDVVADHVVEALGAVHGRELLGLRELEERGKGRLDGARVDVNLLQVDLGGKAKEAVRERSRLGNERGRAEGEEKKKHAQVTR